MLHTAYCLGLMDITLVSDVRYGGLTAARCRQVIFPAVQSHVRYVPSNPAQPKSSHIESFSVSAGLPFSRTPGGDESSFRTSKLGLNPALKRKESTLHDTIHAKRGPTKRMKHKTLSQMEGIDDLAVAMTDARKPRQNSGRCLVTS